MSRRAAIWLGALLGLPVLALAGLVLAMPHLELASFAAGHAAASLGRTVAIDSLRITPGRVIGIELRGVRLGNIAGGTRDEMASLARLSAEVEAWPLLRGAVEMPRATVEGLSLYLERVAHRRGNWVFGPMPDSAVPDSAPPAAPASAPPTDPFGETPPDPVVRPGDRAALPVILDLRIVGSEVTYRTTSGNLLHIALDSTTIAAADAQQPITLKADGSYNAVKVGIGGTMGSFVALRDPDVKFPMDVTATSGDTTLGFVGTAIDPLGVDGLEGRIAVRAGSLDTLLAIAGEGTRHPAKVELDADFVHRDNIWRATNGQGKLDGAAFTAPLLLLTEGTGGQPDHVAVDIALTRLDLNRMLGPAPKPGEADAGDADMPLRVATRPDPEVIARVAVQDLVYAKLRAKGVAMRAALVPGQITVDALSMATLGARVEATGALSATDKGGRITANVAMHDAAVEPLRLALGMRTLPIAGRLQGRVAVVAEGDTLNRATDAAHVSAVVGMTGGSIARSVIEKASTDIRSVFRSAEGMTAVSCLLAVVDMTAGRGEALPLRVRAATGTISGMATFDLNRSWMDLVIGSQSETTHALALDIPMRVSGSFANPDIAPATWSRQGRARLAAGDSIAPLPPALRAFAEENPCLWRGGARR